MRRWGSRSPLEAVPATALGSLRDAREGSAPWSALCLRPGRRTVAGDNLLRQEPDYWSLDHAPAAGRLAACRAADPPD